MITQSNENVPTYWLILLNLMSSGYFSSENGGDMSPDNKIRFKVTVSQAYQALLDEMNKGKPYYRSRRLVELASLGLRLEQGNFSAATHVSTAKQTVQVPQSIPPANANQQTSVNEEPVQSETHYTFPDVTSGVLDDLFGYINKNN
jgi:hypothetical protein